MCLRFICILTRSLFDVSPAVHKARKSPGKFQISPTRRRCDGCEEADREQGCQSEEPRGTGKALPFSQGQSPFPDMTNRQVPEVTPAAWAKARFEVIPLKAAS